MDFGFLDFLIFFFYLFFSLFAVGDHLRRCTDGLNTLVAYSTLQAKFFL